MNESDPVVWIIIALVVVALIILTFTLAGRPPKVKR